MKTFRIIDLKRIRDNTRKNTAEWTNSHGETQADDNFCLTPEQAKKSVYLSFGLSDRTAPHKLTVFAGYAHKFAEALSQATTKTGKKAFDLLSSDPCEYWVNVGRAKGLEVIQAGAENLPERERTIAYVSFEPWPIKNNLTDMVVVIKALAHTSHGYGEFSSTKAFGGYYCEDKLLRRVYDSSNPAFMIARALYGANLFYTISPDLRSDLVMPGKYSKSMAVIDSKVLDFFVDANKTSLSRLCDAVQTTEDEITLSLQRLDEIVTNYFSEQYHVLISGRWVLYPSLRPVKKISIK